MTYYLTLFLGLIAMGPLKFSQTHQTLPHLMVNSFKIMKRKQLDH